MHKAGFVNIIGNPNVGKSTLMNAFVGEKLSIITSKAQTTRHRILGIVNGEDFQMILSDTPGIIKPAYELQASMMDFVKSAFEDADVLIYIVEIGERDLKDEAFFKKITNSKIPVLLRHAAVPAVPRGTGETLSPKFRLPMRMSRKSSGRCAEDHALRSFSRDVPIARHHAPCPRPL